MDPHLEHNDSTSSIHSTKSLSRSGSHHKISVSDYLNLTIGKKSEWGIEGYYIPKKSGIYKLNGGRLPRDKLRSFIYEAQAKGRANPGPTAYANKESWVKPCGLFKGPAKNTFIAEVQKKSRNKPGPGAYKSSSSLHESNSAGKFSKSLKVNLFNDCQYVATQTPGAGKYTLNESLTKPTPPGPRWKVPRIPDPSKQGGKVKVGPGSYNDQQIYLGLKTRAGRAVMPKDRSLRGFDLNKSGTFTPGVGAYNVDQASKMAYKGPSKRR